MPRTPAEEVEAGLRIVAPTEMGDTPAVYANHVQVTFTPEDFTLHLGWYAIPPFSARPPEGVVEVPVRPVLKVTLPLNLMRGVVSVIEGQIQAWEQSFGVSIQPHPHPPPTLRERHEKEGHGETGTSDG